MSGRPVTIGSAGNPAPLVLLVNNDLDIIHWQGPAENYLLSPPRADEHNLVSLMPRGHRTKLREAVRRALQDHSRTLLQIPGRGNGRSGDCVSITIDAMAHEQAQGLLMISFSAQQAAGAGTSDDSRPTTDEMPRVRRSKSRGHGSGNGQEAVDEGAGAKLQLAGSEREIRQLNRTVRNVNKRLQGSQRELERTGTDLANVLNSTDIATLFLDRSLMLRRYTRAALDLMDLNGSCIGKPIGDIPTTLEDPTLEEEIGAVLADLQPRGLEVKARGSRWFTRRILPYSTLDGGVDGVVVTYSDVTTLKSTGELLTVRARQQAVIAGLVQKALGGLSVQGLMQSACENVAKTLELPLVSVLEYHRDDGQLLIRAGVGWREGVVGSKRITADRGSLAGYALMAADPVVVTRLDAESRFRISDNLHEHGAVGGIAVSIRANRDPIGVFSVFADTPRAFTREDVKFLRSVANVLAQAVERAQAASELIRKDDTLIQALAAARLGVIVWEVGSSQVDWSDQIFGILGFSQGEVSPGLSAFLESTHPADKANVERTWKELLSSGGTRGVQHRIVQPGGQERLLFTNGTLLPGATGEPGRVIITVQDITERKAAETEQAQLAGTVMAAPDAMVHTDLQGTVISWNPAAEKLFGYSAAEIVGQKISTIVPPERIDEYKRAVDNRMDGGITQLSETQRLHKDGTLIDVAVGAAPIKDADGEFVGFSLVLHDITELKRATAALQRSEKNLVQAQQIAHMGSWDWDLVAGKTTWSDETYRIFEFERGEVEPSYSSILERVHPDDREGLTAAFTGALKGEPIVGYEHRIVLPDGRVRVLFQQSEIIRGENGQAIRMTGALLDITERKQVEDELARLNQNLEQQVRRRTGYVTLLHDVAAIANQAQSVAEACELTLARLCRETGCVAGRVALSDVADPLQMESCGLWFDAGITVDGEFAEGLQQGPMRAGEGPAAAAISAGAPVWIADLFADSRYSALRGVAPEEVQSGFILPVMDGSRVAALLEMFTHRHGNHDSALMAVLSQAGSHLEQLVRRKRVEDSLRENRSLLRTVIDTIPYPVYATDIESRYTLVNRGFAEFWGRKPEEMIGLRVEDNPNYSAAERKSVIDMDRKVMETGQALERPELRFPNAEGKMTVFRMEKIPLRNQDDAMTGMLGLAEDITQRVQAEQELRESEERLQDFLDNATDLIQSVSMDGRLVYVNKSWRDTLGYSEEEIGDLNIFDLIHPDSLEHCRNVFEQLSQGQTAEDFRVIFVARDGRPVHLSGNANCRFEDGQPVLTRAIFRDITDRKQSEEALRAYAEKLERSNRELQEFAVVASHDLQEPLRKIRAFSDLLSEEYGDALAGNEGGFYLNYIRNAANRMEALIHDLLSLSRVNTQAKPFGPVALEQVIADVLVDLEAKIDEVQARIAVGELPVIDADETQMYQLLMNLISNALKYCGDRPPEIQIAAKTAESCDLPPQFQAMDGQMLALSVRDNGIGFDPNLADKIFGVFQRLHSHTEFDGTGIGLSVCRKIVERHGGIITAEGKPGVGALFTALLPKTHTE